MDQAAKYNSCGLHRPAFQARESFEGRDATTPEVIIQNPTYRNMLLSPDFKERLVCVAVDETHCVWGTISTNICSDRGFMQCHSKWDKFNSNCHNRIILCQLSLIKPVPVGLPPNWPNIVFKVKHKIGVDGFTTSLCEGFKFFCLIITHDSIWNGCGLPRYQESYTLGQSYNS